MRRRNRISALMVLIGMIVTLMPLVGVAQEETEICSDVTVTEYRYEKQILEGEEWVRAPENLQLHGPDEWVSAPVDITNRPGGPWTLGEPNTIGNDQFRYIEFTREVKTGVNLDGCEVTVTVVQECGLIEATVTSNVAATFGQGNSYFYGVQLDGDDQTDQALVEGVGSATASLSFPEDSGDIEVTLSWFAHTETDFIVGGNAPQVFTVDTDCEPPEETTTTTSTSTTTTTQPTTTTTQPTTTTIEAIPPSGSLSLVCEDNTLVASVSIDEEAEVGYHVFITVNGEITDHIEFISNGGTLPVDAPEGAFVKVELFGGDTRLDFEEITVDCVDEPTVTTPTTIPVDELPFTGAGDGPIPFEPISLLLFGSGFLALGSSVLFGYRLWERKKGTA